jgi:hypothetical protein
MAPTTGSTYRKSASDSITLRYRHSKSHPPLMECPCLLAEGSRDVIMRWTGTLPWQSHPTEAYRHVHLPQLNALHHHEGLIDGEIHLTGRGLPRAVDVTRDAHRARANEKRLSLGTRPLSVRARRRQEEWMGIPSPPRLARSDAMSSRRQLDISRLQWMGWDGMGWDVIPHPVCIYPLAIPSRVNAGHRCV